MTNRELAVLFASALEDVGARRRVEASLPARPPRDVPVRLVAIGKAAPEMARGALARWGRAIERSIVVAPDGTDTTSLGRAVVLRAAHPLPDARSVRAGEACLDLVSTREPCSILVLISGGASSLVCAPAPRITLDDKRAVARAMLASGATIQDINVVRKHLSRIKGGGLARAASPNDVLTLVVSDVIGGKPFDVGSGPSVPDPSTVGDARRLLRRFAPAFARLPLVRTLSPADETRSRLRARVVASPRDLASAVAGRLRRRGFVVRVLPASQGRAEALAASYGRLARDLPRRHAIVRAAEPALVIPPGGKAGGKGAGGRCTHVASLVARVLDDDAVRFAAFASDGIDGSSGTAGAVVDARLAGPWLDEAIGRFATGSFHLARRTAIPARPTGHNFADIHVLLRP